MEERQEVQISGLSRLVLPADRAPLDLPTDSDSFPRIQISSSLSCYSTSSDTELKVRKCEGPYCQWALQIGLSLGINLFSVVPQPLTDWTDAESWFT